MPNMPWFRVYSEIHNDIKIKRIHAKTKQPKATIIGVFVILMAIANESSERGKLLVAENLPYTIDDLINETDLDKDTLEEILNEFRNLEMLSEEDCLEIKNWGKRQYKSDNITSRVESFRGKPEPDPEEVVKPKKKPAKPKEYPILADGLPEWVPDQLRAICRAFQDESGISTPVKFETDWNKSLLELSGLGATPDVIIEAVRRLRSKKMTVARPGGVNRTVVSILAEENIKEPKMDADGNLVRI